MSTWDAGTLEFGSLRAGRFKLRWISNAECYLLYSFGFLEGFGPDVGICGATDRTAHGEKNQPPPEQLSSGVLNVRLVHWSFSQNCLGFGFFFSLEVPPRFESLGLEGYNPVSNS